MGSWHTWERRMCMQAMIWGPHSRKVSVSNRVGFDASTFLYWWMQLKSLTSMSSSLPPHVWRCLLTLKWVQPHLLHPNIWLIRPVFPISAPEAWSDSKFFSTYLPHPTTGSFSMRNIPATNSLVWSFLLDRNQFGYRARYLVTQQLFEKRNLEGRSSD